MSVNYIKWHPEPYLADTRHLSFVEHGVYTQLLWLQATHPKGKLPNDLEWICRKICARSEPDRLTVQSILSEYFENDGNSVWNARMFLEWNKAKKNSVRQSDIAKLRWGKEKKASHGTTMAMPNINTNISKENIEKKGSTPNAKPRSRGSRLAMDWKPSSRDIEYALGKGYGKPAISRLAESFKTHWLSPDAKNAVKKCWSSAWQKWVQNDIRFNGSPIPDKKPVKPALTPEQIEYDRQLKELSQGPML